MRKNHLLKTISMLLVVCMCISVMPKSAHAVENEQTIDSTIDLRDVAAGMAELKDIFGAISEDNVPAIIGYEAAVARNHVARLYDDEGTDLNKIVFLNNDYSKTMYLFDFPVKYIDETGSIQDIRLEIADGTTESGKFQTAANDAVTRFPAKFTDGISLEGNDTEIRLVPVLTSANSSTATMSTNGMTANAVANATAQRIDKNTIEYRYDNKTTVEYSLTYTGFKEDIVVSEYTGQTTYPFRLYTNGLGLEEIEDSYYLVDDSGKIKATIGDIIIFTADERNNTIGDIVPTTIVEDEEYLLNIVVDADYLADPDTVYPIRIDPTIEINYDNNGASGIEDITISTNTNFSGSHTSLYIGRRSTEGIARVLMRFPGLNLSNLTGATVTSAAVQLRDLMCEDTPLDISCHVFTGNVWDASSATWANVSPNSYVATPMSTNTLSWSIGKTHSPVHWYSFDISSAVQGWIDSNYSQSKGIIFKTSSTVENGSTIQNRTFGSYNRASYKPSLSITYEPVGGQFLNNDTYYINNKFSGQYMQYTTSGTIAGTAGTISSLNDTIRWDVQKVSNGYVLRAKSDPTKYLGVDSNTSISDLEVVTVSDTAIPTSCIWNITATAGGCLIRNVYNSNYLYTYGTGLHTSSSLGQTDQIVHESRIWRIASTSYYGNTSSYPRQELTSGFSISDLIVNIGETKYLSISNIPSNAFWASVEDFKFTRSSGTSGCISINNLGNTVTGTKSGIATYTATHKVTNRSVTFKVYVDRYTYELVYSFGFDDDVAVLIRDLYNRVDTVFSNEASNVRAWKCARVLSEFCYDYLTYGINKWDDVADSVTDDENREQYFIDTLGYTSQEYALLDDNLDQQHDYAEGNGVIDFCHLQYSLAARLAYCLDYDSFLSNWGTGFFTGNVGYYTDEEISYFAGWLGDAVLRGGSGNTTSFKNDDYMSDLDAENIYHIILQGSSSTQAFSSYYDSLANGSNRSIIFKTHISYDTVRNKVFTELIDAQILNLISYYSDEGDFGMVQVYSDLLNDEEYHWNTINTQYHDTYNFLKSLNDSLSNMANY